MILGTESATLKRFAAGSYSSTGEWTDGTGTTSTISASWQPLNGRELAMLPEGERQRDQRKVYTLTALITSDPRTGLQADHLSLDGSTWYKVEQVEHERAVIPHYKARVVRIQEAA